MSILALNNALSGLKTSQRALGVISDNIANANTEGYVRKIAEPSSVVLDGQGAGVDIGRISRVVDEFLLRERREELGELKAVETIEIYYNQIQDLFGQPGDNNSIAALTERLQTALQNFEVSPEDPFRAQQVIDAADDIAAKLNDMHYALQDLRGRADTEIGEDVDTINALLNQIDEFNVDILTAQAKGQDAGGLKDKRDVALNTLSELIGITYFENSDGAVTITTSGGKTLLDVDPVTVFHDTPNGLRSDIAFDPDRVLADPDLGTIRGILVGGLDEQNDVTPDLRRGEIKGLVDLRDTILPSLVGELDELTRQLRDGVNAVHNLGSAFPPPNALNGQREFNDFLTNGAEFPTPLASNAILFNGTGTIRVSVLQSDPPSQTGDTVQTYTLDLDNLRALAVEADLDAGATTTEKIAAAGQLVVADVVNALQALVGSAATVTFASGRLSVQATDPDQGILIDAPVNVPRSATVNGATPNLDITGLGADVANGSSFQILGADASQLGVVTLSDRDLDGVISFQDIAQAINDETTGIPGVTARIQGFSDGVVGGTMNQNFRLELTADDGAQISIAEVGAAQTAEQLGLIDAAGDTQYVNAVTDADDVLSGQPTVQFAESKGFADPEVNLSKIDGVTTGVTASRLTIATAGGGTAFSNSFDLTTTSLSDVVNDINTKAIQSAVETAVRAAGGTDAQVLAADNAIEAAVPGDITAIAAAVNAALAGAGAVAPIPAAGEQAVFSPAIRASLVNVDGWKIELSAGDGSAISTSGDLAETLGFETQEFGFSHYFGLNDFFAYGDNFSASSDLEVVDGIAADPNLLTRARGTNSILSPTDVGVGGGERTTALTAGDNSGAKILAESMLESRTFSAAGDLPEITLSIPEYATRILSNQALRAAANGDDLQFREDVVGELSFRIEGISGVNIDEELSNLILFQNAFTASARVISASQELLDELVNIVR